METVTSQTMPPCEDCDGGPIQVRYDTTTYEIATLCLSCGCRDRYVTLPMPVRPA